MINSVIKKNGEIQSFEMEKIKTSILKAAAQAGLSQEEQNQLASEISASVTLAIGEKEKISTDEIKDRILMELNNSHPSVAEAWKKYEASKNKG